MRRNLKWLVLFTAVIVVTALYYAKKAHATPPSGFTSATIAMGKFGAIDVSNYFVSPDFSADLHKGSVWLSFEKTRGKSDLYVQSNTWMPGGSTGWHSHPGHSLVIVTAGTVTAYEGNDPQCKPHVYTTGMGFVDPGGNHIHLIRNETTDVAQAVAVQLIPADQARRIMAPDPGNCHF